MSKLQVDDIVNKDDTGSVGFSRGAVVTGVATATTFDGNATTATTAANAQGLTGTPNIVVGVITATTFSGVPEGYNNLKATLFS